MVKQLATVVEKSPEVFATIMSRGTRLGMNFHSLIQGQSKVNRNKRKETSALLQIPGFVIYGSQTTGGLCLVWHGEISPEKHDNHETRARAEISFENKASLGLHKLKETLKEANR